MNTNIRNQMVKKQTKKPKGTDGFSIEFYDEYLDAGHARGRLNSSATIYDGKPGYFCVHKVTVDGVPQDCIIFCCMPHDDILITTVQPTLGMHVASANFDQAETDFAAVGLQIRLPR